MLPCVSLHYTGYELGENLFYSSSQTAWTSVISAWHDEKSHYRYPNGSTNGQPIGHYTQVTTIYQRLKLIFLLFKKSHNYAMTVCSLSVISDSQDDGNITQIFIAVLIWRNVIFAAF